MGDSLGSMRRAADLLHAVLDHIRAGDHSPLGDRAALIVEMRVQEARLLLINADIPREFDIDRTGVVGALKSLEEQLARRPSRAIRVQAVGHQVEAVERLHTGLRRHIEEQNAHRKSEPASQQLARS